MTAPNPVLPGSSVFNTRRTLDGIFHLRPDPEVNQRIEFALAYAAGKHNIDLYSFCSLSNHLHGTHGDPDGCDPEFRRDLHQLITRSINQYRGTREAKWPPNRSCPTTLYDRESLLDKTAYTMANVCRHDLVDDPADWPGVVTKIEELAGPGRIIHRPDGFYDPDGDVPKTVILKFIKPPQFADLSDEEYRQEIAGRVTKLCEVAREKRVLENRKIVGRAKVLAVDTDAKPQKQHAFGALRPRVACEIVTLRIAVLQWLKGFRAVHRFARQLFDGGDRDAEFPKGTFLHRRRYGVTCSTAGPPEPAWT